MPEPAVSVIMPCFNAGAYVRAAVDSVLAQDPPVQLIVVDDGSTDATGAILHGYRDSIEVLAGDHAGVSRARNRAIPRLRGRHTLLLDADDRLVPGALASLLGAADRDRQVVYGRFASWDAGMREKLHDHGPAGLGPEPFVFLAGSNFSPPGALLFPTAAFGHAGCFDPGLVVGEDWDFFARLARCGYGFRGIDVPVLDYRRHAAGASNHARNAFESGCRVIRRCHDRDARLREDRYPAGNRADRLAGNLRNYAAACFALALLNADAGGAAGILREALHHGGNDWKTFGRHFRQSLWWHGLALGGDRDRAVARASAAGAAMLYRSLPRGPAAERAIKDVLYPDMAGLLRRPGPRRAGRYFREWLGARAVLAECRRLREHGGDPAA